MISEIEEIKDVYTKYSMIHEQYSRIESEVRRLEEERKALSELLNETREVEHSLINKIEESLGRKLSTEDLLEIIRTND